MKYLRETTFDFNKDTSATVINMGRICKIIDQNLCSCPINIIVEITDVSESVTDDYLSVRFSPSTKKQRAILEIVASNNVLVDDNLVPIVNKCIDYISKNRNDISNPVWIVHHEINMIDCP